MFRPSVYRTIVKPSVIRLEAIGQLAYRDSVKIVRHIDRSTLISGKLELQMLA